MALNPLIANGQADACADHERPGMRGSLQNAAGTPLPDVHLNVRLGSHAEQLITNESGHFCLTIDDENAFLSQQEILFSVSGTRVGYQPLEFEARLSFAQDDDGRLLITSDLSDKSENAAVDEDGALRLTMRSAVYDAETVVVTATRTRRDLEEVSLPVNVIPSEDIRRAGSMRLDEVLSEQTGLQLVHDHGTGIQVQGFDPDYTLIMIDGSPVIGRTAGTLDLTRVSVQNVEQIEVVKGPSSALWGSDALAGVINIITETPQQNAFSGGLSTRYGRHNTLDLSTDASYSSESWSHKLFANLNRSGGYRLNSEAIAQTVPDFENFTISYNTAYAFSERAKLSAQLRYFDEAQRNQDQIDEGNGPRLLRIESDQRDFLLRPALELRPSPDLRLEASWTSSFYETTSDLRFQDDGQAYDASSFRQYYNKPELQAEYQWPGAPEFSTTVGGGAIVERLDSERYPSEPE
ncbi:MAG: TonB-dependent receptor plug domain-containing protein, partial [Cyclonatronaceae bacterium]